MNATLGGIDCLGGPLDGTVLSASFGMPRTFMHLTITEDRPVFHRYDLRGEDTGARVYVYLGPLTA